MAHVHITLHNLNFTVRLNVPNLHHAIQDLKVKLTSYSVTYNKKINRLTKIPDKSYYTYDPITKLYRFPITLLKDFINTLGLYKVTKDQIRLINKQQLLTPAPLNLTWNKSIIPRDYQEEYITILKNNINKKYLLIDLATGMGKSLILTSTIVQLNQRAMFLLLPKYVKKWVDDFKKYTNIKNKDIYIVQGEDTLIKLMLEPNIKYKVILVSIPTIVNYIRDYENGTKDYPVIPSMLLQHLNIGVLANDETHQHFHAISRALSYFDANVFIGSTATLDSHETHMKNIYKAVIPYSNRVTSMVTQDPYIDIHVISYRLLTKKQLKHKTHKGYNHILYETSILNYDNLTKMYFEMVDYYIKRYFMDLRQPEDKIAIFFGSINMCNSFYNYISNEYPKEKVYRYIGGDDYKSMFKHNIIVTNHSMLGTGIDVPNLTTVIQTVSVASYQANMQNFGRLRKLENKDTRYIYLYTNDIPPQTKLHYARLNTIKSKAKSITFREYHIPLKY